MVLQLPVQVKNMLAIREHRIHHYLWHAVRDGWLRFDPTAQNDLRNKGWEPPRPALDSNRRAIHTNGSGEDFLFMHRQMIIHVNSMLSQIQDPSYPAVKGWVAIPSPSDIDYPVPIWADAPPSIQDSKTSDFYDNWMKPREIYYTDPSNLAQITLGELGSRLEYSIHNAMHLRWSSKPLEFRPPIEPTNADTIDVKWDNPSYDFLADTYSSHVNPIFWKLHGWIDDRIEDWKQAHGITGPIPWSVQWNRNMMPHHGIVHATDSMVTIEETSTEDSLTNMLEVAKIVQKTNVFPSFEILDDGFH
ncbi:Tat pathway signal protein [Candidatus Nitrosocosmicus sp. T]